MTPPNQPHTDDGVLDKAEELLGLGHEHHGHSGNGQYCTGAKELLAYANRVAEERVKQALNNLPKLPQFKEADPEIVKLTDEHLDELF